MTESRSVVAGDGGGSGEQMGLRALFRMSKVIGGSYRIVHNFQNSSNCWYLKLLNFTVNTILINDSNTQKNKKSKSTYCRLRGIALTFLPPWQLSKTEMVVYRKTSYTHYGKRNKPPLWTWPCGDQMLCNLCSTVINYMHHPCDSKDLLGTVQLLVNSS